MTVKAGAAAQFLGFMGFTEDDMKKAADMIADASLTKAVPHSENDSMPMVQDRWNKGEMHKVPGRDAINPGPSQSASGGGAEHMVRTYSHTTPQKGVQLEAEHLEAELGPMRGYAKAIADGHNGLCQSFDHFTALVKGNLDELVEQNRRLTIVAAGLLKAQEEKGDDDEEKEEKFEINAAKARAAYAKARELLKKSRSIRASMKAASDAGHIGALKAQSKLFKKAAQAYLSKAEEYSKAGSIRAVVTRKALDEFFAKNPALKAEIDPSVDAKSLRKAALKARSDWKKAIKSAEIKKDDDKGNQDDSEKKENHNQEDHAAKAAVEGMAGKVEEALKGLGMLQTDVRGLMETITGRPITPKPAPLEMSKGAVVDFVRKVDGMIEQYATERRIDNSMEHRARDVLQKYDALQKGVMSEAAYDAYLGQSPQIVQEIFKLAKAA